MCAARSSRELSSTFPDLDSTSKKYAPVNLAALQAWVASGRLDASQAIDVGLIFRSNLVHGIKGWSGVKLLGEVSQAFIVLVDHNHIYVY